MNEKETESQRRRGTMRPVSVESSIVTIYSVTDIRTIRRNPEVRQIVDEGTQSSTSSFVSSLAIIIVIRSGSVLKGYYMCTSGAKTDTTTDQITGV